MNDLFSNKGNWTPELNPLQGQCVGQNNEMFNSSYSFGFKAKSKLPHILLKMGKSGEGEDYTSSVNKTPNAQELEDYIRPTKNMSDDFLASDFKFGLKNGISLGGFFSGDVISNKNARKYAELFVDHLMTGNGKTWHDDGVLSAGMKKTPEVKSFTDKVKTEFKNLMSNKFGAFWQVKLNKNNYSNISFSFGSSPTLKGLVGGTQKTIVSIQHIVYNATHRKWLAILVLQIEDDFGVSESDVTNPRGASARVAKPSLADFWVLQHQRGKKPFTTVFKIPFFCEGNY